MDPLFDEVKADKAIIKSLLATNRTLWGELESKRSMIQSLERQIKRSYPMSRIMQDVNGVLYLVHHFEIIAEEKATELLADLKNDVGMIEGALGAKDTPVPTAPAAPTTPEATPEAAPDAAPDAPVAPAEPVAPAAPLDAPVPPVEQPPLQ